MMKYSDLARKAIKSLPEYKSARSLFEGTEDTIYLDANECAYEPYVGASGLNRYPAQQPRKAIEALCRLYDVSSKNLMVRTRLLMFWFAPFVRQVRTKYSLALRHFRCTPKLRAFRVWK